MQENLVNDSYLKTTLHHWTNNYELLTDHMLSVISHQ